MRTGRPRREPQQTERKRKEREKRARQREESRRRDSRKVKKYLIPFLPFTFLSLREEVGQDREFLQGERN